MNIWEGTVLFWQQFVASTSELQTWFSASGKSAEEARNDAKKALKVIWVDLRVVALSYLAYFRYQFVGSTIKALDVSIHYAPKLDEFALAVQRELAST